jgi:hypothetical protein
MWMDKLAGGLLRISTPLGPRFVSPSFFQRLYLVWLFRNFQSLPMQVLSPRQRRMVESLFADNRRIAQVPLHLVHEAPVIGTVERRPPVEDMLPPKRPSAPVSEHAVPPLIADQRQSS